MFAVCYLFTPLNGQFQMHRALPVPDEAVWRHVTAFQQDICENVVIEACTDQGSLLFPKVEFFFIKAHTRGLSFL